MFTDFEFSWQGKPYVIPASKRLRIIASVEEIVTFKELMEGREEGRGPPLAKISMAFAAIIRSTGTAADDNEVYSGMFSGGGVDAANAVTALLMLMLPPSSMNGDASGEHNRGNSRAARRAAARASKVSSNS